MSKVEFYDFEAEIVEEREFALLLMIHDEEVWFPKRVVECNDDGSFTVPLEWAEEKGIV